MAATPIIADPSPSSPRRRPSTILNSNSPRITSQHSIFARSVLMSKLPTLAQQSIIDSRAGPRRLAPASPAPAPPSTTPAAAAAAASGSPPRSVPPSKDLSHLNGNLKPKPSILEHHGIASSRDGVGLALSDTPLPSAPASPRM